MNGATQMGCARQKSQVPNDFGKHTALSAYYLMLHRITVVGYIISTLI